MFGLSDYKNKKSGFSLVELLVSVAIISLLASVAFASITKARDRAVYSRLSQDFGEIKKVVEMYLTQNGVEPCHRHDMSDAGERVWSVGYFRSWPTSPMRTKYFFTHTGDVNSPTSNDYYYIGVTLDPKTAQEFDKLYDDNNLSAGLFRYQAAPPAPLEHYSYFVSYYTSGSHSHCP